MSDEEEFTEALKSAPKTGGMLRLYLHDLDKPLKVM